MLNPIEKFKVAIVHLNRAWNHCYLDNTLRELKQARRTAENVWRKDKDNTILRSEFKARRNHFEGKLHSARTDYLSKLISDANGDQKKLYRIIQSLASVKRDNPLPEHSSITQLANDFGDFFVKKINDIRAEIDSKRALSADLSSEPTCPQFSEFKVLTEFFASKWHEVQYSADNHFYVSDFLRVRANVILGFWCSL